MTDLTTPIEQLNTEDTATKKIFICGSALKGQPDHQNLQSAKFIKTAKTKPLYRLHAAENGWHPAIYEVENGGISIPGEIYELTIAQYEYLLANEPPHMYPSDVISEDGEILTAMLYPRELVEKHQWLDISDLGGWANYKTMNTAPD
ncbi:AIG2-like family protein [Synechococcus sp. PCC 7502]|uniref:gamma-glutamylcyclotransferase family protein n=1 Tax=Synechococcus sp. PCC 7502 TaxID=1173263 RepID=UPI00029F8F21|nr:gamma-glutamylcyclotransferase family protein [Synechococcus sp. PCC 7502]AFY73278.1 AIG2-like family protein [Synechococcus sp. PCC 7502]